MDSLLINRGLDLMLFGMGTVFIFLTILIFATTAMSAVITRWFPEKIIEADKPRRAPPTFGSVVAPTTLKILQAAVDQHRKR